MEDTAYLVAKARQAAAITALGALRRRQCRLARVIAVLWTAVPATAFLIWATWDTVIAPVIGFYVEVFARGAALVGLS